MRCLAVVLACLAALAAAAPAAAQTAPCAAPAPELRSVTVPPQIRAGERLTLPIGVAGAETVEVDWGDGTRSTLRGGTESVDATHVYAASGAFRPVATVRSCAGAASGAVSLTVLEPCRVAIGPAAFEEDCDAVRGTMTVASRGLATTGTWVDAPCRDNPVVRGPQPPEPVATAAACAATRGPIPVPAFLPVRHGDRLTIRLGATATSVRVLFDRGLGVTARRRSAHRFVARVPRSIRGRYKVAVRVRRPGSGEDWLVGLRIR